MYSDSFPRQALPRSKKTKEWAKKCVLWASTGTVLNSSLIRKTVAHKKLNYDLLCGKLNMSDLASVINPSHFDDGQPIYKIQHYPIMNVKLDLLRGEERDSYFDFKVIVTNPNAVSEIEEAKKNEITQQLQQLAAETSLSEEDYNAKIEKMNDFFQYDWQDIREIRANCLLNHYYKELNLPQIFNDGFMDLLTVKEEIYRVGIVGDDLSVERLNPEKVRIYKSGYSNHIEDADIISIEDYWQPGRIIDTYYDVLTEKQIKQIENYNKNSTESASESPDPREEFILPKDLRDAEASVYTDGDGFNWVQFADGVSTSALPYDMFGNIRVLQVYWKSLRKIKKVKRYDPQTGNETFEFFTEDYICDESKGEEEKVYLINEAWEGTMIGAGDEAIFINMRPRKIQYNRLTNPSRCHFGIIGTIYNTNDQKPYSMVDMMKPYNYLYDVIQDRLNKLLARNMGKLVRFDFATAPAGWSPEQWLYYIKNSGLLVTDSFKEGVSGQAKGKIAGMLNNPQTVIDAELGNSIQQYINLLEFIKVEMADIVGISKQREGQIANRETVGGVERATLQSSYITRWMFSHHNDLKKRVLECCLETLKYLMRDRHNKKIQYITPDGAQKVIDIPGDEFAENDYGLVVDASQDTTQLNQKIDMIAQAAMQNQALSFSTYLKLAENCSLAEKIRMVEKNERELQQMQQQQQQQANEVAQQQIEANMALQQAKLELDDTMNQRDNETKLIIANINAINNAEEPMAAEDYTEKDRRDLEEKIREFDAKLKLDRDKYNLDKERLAFDKERSNKEINSREKIAKMRPNKSINNNK